MARNDLMGLAALGALGLLMNQNQSQTGDQTGAPAPGVAPSTGGDDFYSPEGMGSGPAPQAPRVAAAPSAGPALDPSRADLEASMTRGQRGDGRFITPQQAARRYVPRPSGDAPVARAGARYGSMSGADALAALDAATGVRPMDPNSPRGPNAVTGTELGRNVRNTLNALTPIGGGVAGAGLSVAREFGAASPVQRAYNASQAARRSAEGFSPAEAMARRKLMEEAAMEGGMKRGGAVKKKAAAKPKSTPSSRGDGIAMRGKTRGKMR